MPNQTIQLPEIKGMFTNADPEDIPENMATLLQNLRNNNGKLEKTFGFGVFNNTATGITPVNIFTYFHDQLSTPKGSGDGYVFILLDINSGTNVLTTYYWNGSAWTDIDNMLENTLSTYYHAYAKNPVIQVNGILRLLPGHLATGVGVWIGYIDRDYFDELFLADTDYDAGFYGYDTNIPKPSITFTKNIIQGGEFSPEGRHDIRYYRFSNIYDGNQEGMLSDPIKVDYDNTYVNSLFSRFEYLVTLSSFNKRNTGLKVYRCDTNSGEYYHVHTINYNRKQSDVFGATSGGYAGSSHVYIPELTSYDFTSAYNYMLTNKDGTKIYFTDKTGIDGTENTVFALDAPYATTEHWDLGWRLYENDGGGYDQVESGATGLFCGDGCFIFSEDMSDFDLTGGIAYLNTDAGGLEITGAATHEGGTKTTFTVSTPLTWSGNIMAKLSGFSTNTQYNGNHLISYVSDYTFRAYIKFGSTEAGYFEVFGEERVITDVNQKAVKFDGSTYPFHGSVADAAWAAMSPLTGMYRMVDESTNIRIVFYDNNLTDADEIEHPFQNAVSINMNGGFAQLLKGRLCQADLILDPGDENEVHRDWLGYSELEQYDVFNVSNVKISPNAKGGSITQLLTSFGNIVMMQENAYTKLEMVDPSEPFTWIWQESVFRRGNIARDGCLEVNEKLYPVCFDGIYEIDVNMLANSDETPMLKNRISEDINDLFLDLTKAERAAIVAGYDTVRNEIIYKFATGYFYAYDIVNKTWRLITSAKTVSCWGYDHNGNLIGYDTTDDKLCNPCSNLTPTGAVISIASAPTDGGTGYTVDDVLTITTDSGDATVTVTEVDAGVVTALSLTTGGTGHSVDTGQATSGGTGSGCTVAITAVYGVEDVIPKLITKSFKISEERDEIIRRGFMTVRSSETLHTGLYLNNSDTLTDTGDISSTSDVATTTLLALGKRAKSFKFCIYGD